MTALGSPENTRTAARRHLPPRRDSPAAARPEPSLLKIGGLAGIISFELAAYAPALRSSFHFDDFALFADPFLASPDGWWRVFRLSQTRPLTYFTFWLHHRLGGDDPFGYHAVNLAVHIAATLIAWAVLRSLLGPRGGTAAAGVFALHPLQTEAVAYVFARATLLAAFFCLLCWRDWLAGRRWRACAWFLLALLSKEECAAFPFFLLALDWVQKRWRRQMFPALALMCGASAAAGARLLFVAGRTKGAGVGAVNGITPLQYLLTQPKVICRYLALFLYPAGQNFDHDIAIFSPRSGIDLAALALLAGLLCFSVWKLREGGVWVLGGLILLAPSSSLVPLSDLMFEHRMYLPLISLSAAAGLVLQRVRWPVWAAAAVALSAATWARARVWSTDETLWSDAAAKSPAKVRPKLQWARAIAHTDPLRAQLLLAEAQRLASPSDPEPYTQMGTLLLDQNRPAQALAAFEEALRRAPHSADAHSNRGTALFLLGRLREAGGEWETALALDPCHYGARHNLLLLYQRLGNAAGRERAARLPARCRLSPAQAAEFRTGP
jgi:tetratricopeptide (TPR) repeat protein